MSFKTGKRKDAPGSFPADVMSFCRVSVYLTACTSCCLCDVYVFLSLPLLLFSLCFFLPSLLSHSLIIELVLSLVRVGSLLRDTETSQVYRTPRYPLSPSLARTPSCSQVLRVFLSLSHTHTHSDADKLSSLQPNASPLSP